MKRYLSVCFYFSAMRWLDCFLFLVRIFKVQIDTVQEVADHAYPNEAQKELHQD